MISLLTYKLGCLATVSNSMISLLTYKLGCLAT